MGTIGPELLVLRVSTEMMGQKGVLQKRHLDVDGEKSGGSGKGNQKLTSCIGGSTISRETLKNLARLRRRWQAPI